MNTKVKEKIWFIFCVLFIISYMRINYFSIFRFIGLGAIQLIAIIYIMKNKIKIEYNKQVLICVLCILLCMVISNFNTEDIKESIIKIISVLDLFVVSIILIPTFFKDVELKRILLNTSYAFVLVLSICAIVYRNDFIYTYGMGRIGGETRLYAGLEHPNTLGIFSFLCFINSFVLCIYYKKDIKLKERLIIYFSIIISLFLIMRADCRTAMLSCVIFTILVLFSKLLYKKDKLKLMIVILSIGIIIVFILINIDKFTIDQLDKILSYRLTYIERAMDDLQQNDELLFGKGAFRNSNTSSLEAVLLDNGYMNTIYQFGLVTFGFVILLEIRLLLQIIRNKEGREKEILLQFFIIFLIYSIPDNILLNISSFFAVYMYALISTYTRTEKKDEKNEKIVDSYPRI